ncbi:MAG TPA: FtsQ-type POTRA domain-containing protein [Sandaracinaceae bacterium LLY-WYZ-13_1]|nr:FtsQ-type POTRA domain-containing protein [Sandaracinaceae bacterium LLY-WYZ-13_1]
MKRRRKPAPAEPKGRPRNRRVRPKKGAAESEAPPPPRRSVRERWASGVEAGRGLLARLRRPAELLLRAVAVVAVGVGAVALGRLVERHVRTSEAFAVTEIQLEGHVRLTQHEVLSTAGLAEGRNVFDVAPEEAEERLAAHPWIAEADVRRRLPGTYAVEIRERRAVALLALGDVYLVSEDGAVFKKVEPTDPVDLPIITGIDRERFTRDRGFRTSVLLEAVALLHDYRGAGLWRREPIAELHVERDDGLSLYVGADATYVRLGHGPFRAKLRRLRTVLDELSERDARALYVYLDNERRPDRVTVRVRDEAPVADAETDADDEEPATEDG